MGRLAGSERKRPVHSRLFNIFSGVVRGLACVVFTGFTFFNQSSGLSALNWMHWDVFEERFYYVFRHQTTEKLLVARSS